MSSLRRLPLILVLAAAIALAGCSRSFQVTFEPNGAPLDAAGAESLARGLDISALSSFDSASAPTERQTVLKDLRLRGQAGDRAATLLTEGFPPDTPSVPVLVRISPFGGRQALVVVEAYGDASGPLAHRRLWVFDLETGAVLDAASYK